MRYRPTLSSDIQSTCMTLTPGHRNVLQGHTP